MSVAESPCGDGEDVLHLFLLAFKHVIPTQRGAHISKIISRGVNCRDAEILEYMYGNTTLGLFVVHGRCLALYNFLC